MQLRHVTLADCDESLGFAKCLKRVTGVESERHCSTRFSVGREQISLNSRAGGLPGVRALEFEASHASLAQVGKSLPTPQVPLVMDVMGGVDMAEIEGQEQLRQLGGEPLLQRVLKQRGLEPALERGTSEQKQISIYREADLKVDALSTVGPIHLLSIEENSCCRGVLGIRGVEIACTEGTREPLESALRCLVAETGSLAETHEGDTTTFQIGWQSVVLRPIRAHQPLATLLLWAPGAPTYQTRERGLELKIDGSWLEDVPFPLYVTREDGIVQLMVSWCGEDRYKVVGTTGSYYGPYPLHSELRLNFDANARRWTLVDHHPSEWRTIHAWRKSVAADHDDAIRVLSSMVRITGGKWFDLGRWGIVVHSPPEFRDDMESRLESVGLSVRPSPWA